MATLYITEYRDVTRDPEGGRILCGLEPAIATQTRTFTATSSQSAAFASNTRFVRLVADAACCVLFGTNPTALQTSTYLSAGSSEYFGLATQGLKVAARTP